MNLRDEQWLRILEVLNLRVRELEQRQAEIDEEIRDEVHEIRGIANTIALEMQKRRMKK